MLTRICNRIAFRPQLKAESALSQLIEENVAAAAARD